MDHHVGVRQLNELLHGLGEFVYYPNFGNLGDLLIAEGTRQFFHREELRYREYDEGDLPDEYNLVYAGGARFTSCWCDTESCLRELTDPRIKCCVILPHSFYDVDALLGGLDGRHHLFCRDERSYRYCLSRQTTYSVYLAEDMAFQLDMGELDTTRVPHGLSSEERRTQAQIRRGLFTKLRRGVRRATASAPVGGEEKKIAFLLREDAEKSSATPTVMSYDISTAWHTSGRKMAFNAEILRQFSGALKQADIVVSDRLHVCIMAFLSGLEVYMLDNSYGKLSGVYRLSLSDAPQVHLLPHAELTPELRVAWDELNASGRVLMRRWQTALFSALKQCRAVLRRCRRALCGGGRHS